jgi:hypothetical protein
MEFLLGLLVAFPYRARLKKIESVQKPEAKQPENIYFQYGKFLSVIAFLPVFEACSSGGSGVLLRPTEEFDATAVPCIESSSSVTRSNSSFANLSNPNP